MSAQAGNWVDCCRNEVSSAGSPAGRGSLLFTQLPIAVFTAGT